MHEIKLNTYFLESTPYSAALNAMQQFTATRNESTTDELWVLQHPPTYTQGVAGKPEHFIYPNNIPLIQSDRGGQITYHGPGQLIFYTLFDLKRLELNIREFVSTLENTTIALLNEYGIQSSARSDAPGIYVDGAKIASLGLRVKKFRCYHGLALNVDMDLTPFYHINPCGMPGMKMTQLGQWVEKPDFLQITDKFISHLQAFLGYTKLNYYQQHPLL